jgi:hypothetical protein
LTTAAGWPAATATATATDPDRYRDRDRDSNRHSNSNTAPNSNSHSIGHIYSDGYRYANGSADRHWHAHCCSIVWTEKRSLCTRIKS